MPFGFPYRVCYRDTFLDTVNESDDERNSQKKNRSKSLEPRAKKVDPIFAELSQHLMQSAARLISDRSQRAKVRRQEMEMEGLGKSIGAEFSGKLSNSLEGSPIEATTHYRNETVNGATMADNERSDNISLLAPVLEVERPEKIRLLLRNTFIDVVIEALDEAQGQHLRRSVSLPPPATTSSPPHVPKVILEYADILVQRAAELRTRSKSRGCGKVFREMPSQPWTLDTKDGPLVATGGAQLPDAISQGSFTTLMICGLSTKVTKRGLAKFLDQLGFAGQVDGMHFPARNRSFGPNSSGYAFINFIRPEAAKNFVQTFENSPFCVDGCRRRPLLRVARIQGSDAMEAIRLQDLDRNRRVGHPGSSPLD